MISSLKFRVCWAESGDHDSGWDSRWGHWAAGLQSSCPRRWHSSLAAAAGDRGCRDNPPMAAEEMPQTRLSVHPRIVSNLSEYPDRFIRVPGQLGLGLQLGWKSHMRPQVQPHGSI